MSSFGDDAPALIQTKLHRPRLGQDLISRPHLIGRLNQGLDRKLTLISAQAGSGKSTLLAQWLQQRPQPSVWLSLDEDDNNLMVFASYLCAAIQTVFPSGCEQVLDLLNAPVAPPPRIITTLLINELVSLCDCRNSPDERADGTEGLVVALDDFHAIKEPTIHELVSELIAYLPQCVHLVLSTRTDPPLPLAALRAKREMTELRSDDLQLTKEEAGKLLELTTGRKLGEDTVDLLRDKTEGWLVGLRLAALSIRDLPDDSEIAKRLEGTSSSFVADYVVSEVLSQQSPALQDFLLRSSILNRFCADLCDAVLWSEDDFSPANSQPGVSPSRAILKELRSVNLFLLPLDQEERWFRYHHLFRDLLQHRLQRQHDAETIGILHRRASHWYEQHGFIEEALSHAFAAEDLCRAAQIVARRRHRLMNQARWQILDRYASRFPSEFANQQVDLLMLKAWLLYHQGHYGRLPAALAKVEDALVEEPLSLESTRQLKGEISALRSLLYYYQTDVDRTKVEADFAIKNTAPEIWIVRILARLFLAGAYQMEGDLKRAYGVVYQGVDAESLDSDRYRATMLITVSNVYWIAADLQGLIAAASQCLKFSNHAYAAEIRGYAKYHLGSAYYQLNDLEAAERNFLAVTNRPYLNYGDGFAHSAFGLALTYLAQGSPDEADQVAAMAINHMVETDNTTLLPLAWAFQAELALRQSRLAVANQWAAQFDTIPPLSPMVRLYRFHFTLAKTWLANGTQQSRQRAAGLLTQIRDYAEATHNTSALAEALALQAILSAAEDDEPSALQELEAAIELTQPGGFIRLFVDLGTPMADLLRALQDRGVKPAYIGQILAAFPESGLGQDQMNPTAVYGPASDMVDSLTPRELEVLELLSQRLTNKEIAEKLVISPGTVKTHTLNIYSKLDARGRRQAVDKARELLLLRET